MEKLIKISGSKRTNLEKKNTRELRKMDKIPAIIYGLHQDPIALSIDYPEIEKVLKSKFGRNSILEMIIDDKNINSIIKEIQYDYLGDNIIHMDFLRIDIKKRVTISIPIVLTGEPIGVRLEEGILDFITRKLEISCFPEDIVKDIEIDISNLHTGSSIKADSLDLSEKLELLSNKDTVICAVTGIEEEEEEVVEEEEEEVTEEAAEEEGTKDETDQQKKTEPEKPTTSKEDSKK